MADIGCLDDRALTAFLAPGNGGIRTRDLATALIGCEPALTDRVVRSLTPTASLEARAIMVQPASEQVIAAARRRVLRRLFWPLVYWLRPDDYDALVEGELINPRVLEELDLDGRVICDIGAGSGRFALAAAMHASRVIAVDAVPELLHRLETKAAQRGLGTIETRRGEFANLPVADDSVDIAVACSSFETRGPHGGARALDEAERIVRPGGLVAVIWPQYPRWFLRRGYQYVRMRGSDSVRFRDIETAERLCSAYYSAAAARWVRDHETPEVPYAVLGVSPPRDVCLKTVA